VTLFLFFNRAIAHAREPIFANNSPKEEVWCKEDPFGNKTSLSRKPCIPIKSYYASLSESHGRSISIRHEKSPEAPLGGEITMTLYPVGNKTSLFWNKCTTTKNLLWNAIKKSQNPS